MNDAVIGFRHRHAPPVVHALDANFLMPAPKVFGPVAPAISRLDSYNLDQPTVLHRIARDEGLDAAIAVAVGQARAEEIPLATAEARWVTAIGTFFARIADATLWYTDLDAMAWSIETLFGDASPAAQPDTARVQQLEQVYASLQHQRGLWIARVPWPSLRTSHDVHWIRQWWESEYAQFGFFRTTAAYGYLCFPSLTFFSTYFGLSRDRDMAVTPAAPIYLGGGAPRDVLVYLQAAGLRVVGVPEGPLYLQDIHQIVDALIFTTHDLVHARALRHVSAPLRRTTAQYYTAIDPALAGRRIAEMVDLMRGALADLDPRQRIRSVAQLVQDILFRDALPNVFGGHAEIDAYLRTHVLPRLPEDLRAALIQEGLRQQALSPAVNQYQP